MTVPITAVEMAKQSGISDRKFRHYLRLDKACSDWHEHRRSWTVERDSKRHNDMKRVLAEILSRR